MDLETYVLSKKYTDSKVDDAVVGVIGALTGDKTIDLTAYYKKSEVDEAVNSLEKRIAALEAHAYTNTQGE